MSIVCEHGSLKRSCEICERDEEIARLKERNKKIIGRCVCGHYHCPICGNQMEVFEDATYELFLRSKINKLRAENNELKEACKKAIKSTTVGELYSILQAAIEKHKDG